MILSRLSCIEPFRAYQYTGGSSSWSAWFCRGNCVKRHGITPQIKLAALPARGPAQTRLGGPITQTNRPESWPLDHVLDGSRVHANPRDLRPQTISHSKSLEIKLWWGVLRYLPPPARPPPQLQGGLQQYLLKPVDLYR